MPISPFGAISQFIRKWIPKLAFEISCRVRGWSRSKSNIGQICYRVFLAVPISAADENAELIISLELPARSAGDSFSATRIDLNVRTFNATQLAFFSGISELDIVFRPKLRLLVHAASAVVNKIKVS